MGIDPKAQESRKIIEELLKKLAGDKVDGSKLDALIKEGNSLKGDKDIPE
jgi:hypothetical protein